MNTKNTTAVSSENETLELIETSIRGIKSEKDELKLGLEQVWINFIDSIDDGQIENFLWTLSTCKVLPYLEFMTFNRFIEFLKWELIAELKIPEELEFEILKLDCEVILDYLEITDSLDLRGILPNGFDLEFNSLIEITEFDIERFASDFQKKDESITQDIELK